VPTTPSVTQTAGEGLAVIKATAAKYFAGASDLTIRKRLMLSLLAKYGRIIYDENGVTNTWLIQHDEPPVTAHGAGGEISFDEHDLFTSLTTDWRGYIVTDKMHEKDRLMNKGEVAIVDRYRRIIPQLRQSLDNKFHGEFYIDGDAANNDNRIHGMETFLASGTTVAADLVAKPDDKYGGQDTDVGALGGTWSTDLATASRPNASIATDWPHGAGSSAYDALSPTLLNTSSTSWGTGSTSWEDNCARVLRQGVHWLTKNGGSDGKPTSCFLASNFFVDFQNYQEAKMRITVQHSEAEDLGFSDVLKFDGLMIKSEFDVPAGNGYIINAQQMELASLAPVMFFTKGPEFDMRTMNYLFYAGFFGNVRYQPKFFGKLKAYA